MDNDQKLTLSVQSGLKVACIQAASREGKFVSDWIRETLEARLLAEGFKVDWPKYCPPKRKVA